MTRALRTSSRGRCSPWLGLLVLGLAPGDGLRADARADAPLDPRVSESPEFVFARIHYDSEGGWGEAYYNPFLYMCDPGYMKLEPEEKELLREYLESGGFLWVDDFWGEGELWNFEREMAGVFPESGWRDIPADHPILHSVFDLPGAPQIPAQDFAVRGWKTDPGWIHRSPATQLTPVNFRGYFDKQGRLVVVATHNTDTGDGFEREAYGQWYFEKYSTQAYMIGVNIVVYAMSH